MAKKIHGAPDDNALVKTTSYHRWSAFGGAALIVGAIFTAGQAGAQVASSSTMPAWYTSEQADLGQRAYNSSCIACHGDAMLGMFSEYETAAKFMGFISGSMPAESPGSLPTEDYLAIIAYLMRDMGYPAGEEPLMNKRDVLLEIQPRDSHEALGFSLDAPKP